MPTPDTKKLKAELGKKKAKLNAALDAVETRLKADNDLRSGSRKTSLRRRHVLGFFGPTAAAKKRKQSRRRRRENEARRDHGLAPRKVEPGDFRSPGERRALPARGVNVYVLGPPRSVASVKKMDPSGDQGYKTHADSVSLLGAIEWLSGSEARRSAGAVRRQLPRASRGSRVETHSSASSTASRTTRSATPARSGGGSTTTGSAAIGRLALQLDRGVNNTSLALAFELPGGRTLIFPGDAQIGNWLSWDDVSFKDEAGNTLPTTSKQLLNRAVFYKVGHHGSHNATRKAGGLEEMTSGELVAMIPTDEQFALKQSPPHGWKMPFSDLMTRCKKFTSHRVLRADRGKDDLKSQAEDSDATEAAWSAFAGRVTFATKLLERDPDSEKDAPDQPLYVEYSIPE